MALVHTNQSASQNHPCRICDFHHIAGGKSTTNFHYACVQERDSPRNERRAGTIIDGNSTSGLCGKRDPQLSCRQTSIVSRKRGANRTFSRHCILQHRCT